MRLLSGIFNPSEGKCARRTVHAILIPANLPAGPGDPVFIGTNSCRTPQKECPRKEGEDYSKCKSVCHQSGHAEIRALKNAGDHAKGATVVIIGHTHCCKECMNAMNDAGVRTVVIP